MIRQFYSIKLERKYGKEKISINLTVEEID